jgi:hypothetical protein
MAKNAQHPPAPKPSTSLWTAAVTRPGKITQAQADSAVKSYLAATATAPKK